MRAAKTSLCPREREQSWTREFVPPAKARGSVAVDLCQAVFARERLRMQLAWKNASVGWAAQTQSVNCVYLGVIRIRWMFVCLFFKSSVMRTVVERTFICRKNKGTFCTHAFPRRWLVPETEKPGFLPRPCVPGPRARKSR